jgi:hypothetical protein
VFVTFVACIFAASITFYFYSRITPEFILTAVALMQNAGFAASKIDVHGANIVSFFVVIIWYKFLFCRAICASNSIYFIWL